MNIRVVHRRKENCTHNLTIEVKIALLQSMQSTKGAPIPNTGPQCCIIGHRLERGAEVESLNYGAHSTLPRHFINIRIARPRAIVSYTFYLRNNKKLRGKNAVKLYSVIVCVQEVEQDFNATVTPVKKCHSFLLASKQTFSRLRQSRMRSRYAS